MPARLRQSRWIANKRFPIGERQIDTRLDDLDSGIADQYVNAAFLTTKACLKHMYSYPSRFSAARSWTRNHSALPAWDHL
jgi:hypothetical protein